MKFNKKSKKLIAEGKKVVTSRRKRHDDDPDVLFCFNTPLTKFDIGDLFHREEGCKSPEEYYRWINQIWRRRVPLTQELYVHVISPECIERIKREKRGGGRKI